MMIELHKTSTDVTEGRMFDVCGIGYVSIDHVLLIPSNLKKNTKSGLAGFTVSGGGPAATALVALSRLGANTVFCGKVADDSMGRNKIEELQSEGVDASGVVVEKGTKSEYIFVLVEQGTGRRTILGHNGTVSALKPHELKKNLIINSKFLHLDLSHFPAGKTAIKWAKEKNVPVCVDAEWGGDSIREIISLIDVLIVPENFGKIFLGISKKENQIKDLLKMGAKIVCITLGEKGCLCSDGGELLKIPAFKVPVIDTTGAGDVFHGAFIFGLLKGWNLRKVCVFASAVSAMKCRQLGGRLGIPVYEEARKFLKWKRQT